MLPPRPLLAVSLLLLGGLAWTVEGRPPPQVDLADAARWEGQAVVVEGWAESVSVAADGALRLALTAGRHGMAARVAPDGSSAPAQPLVQRGDRVAVEGRPLRSPGGDLQLLADGAGALRRVAGESIAEPGWDLLAKEPGLWTGRLLRLTGEVDRGDLRGPGHAVHRGDGPWPQAGAAVAAEGFLRYDAACLCFAFDAVAVRPWTP